MEHRRLEKAIGKYLNTKWITNEGYEVEIIEYYDSSNCTIRFNTSYETIKYKVTIQNLKKGKIKYPYHPSVYCLGFIGEGFYKPSINRKDTKVYKHWSSMLQRSGNGKVAKRHPTYKDVTVCEEWKCFQIFAAWYDENYKEYMNGWHLDKDVLVKRNKIYSPETCCLVPQEINTLFVKNNSTRGECPIGVSKHGMGYQADLCVGKYRRYLGTFTTIEEAFYAYKVAKEEYGKEVADKGKPLIKPNIYEAMYNYEVEIDD